MATFVSKLVLRTGGQLPPPGQVRFGDDDGSPHEIGIERLAAASWAGLGGTVTTQGSR